ncbi:unnamed protein product [Linum tenue]|uniref:Pentatricopeptide repeat-containing protein n=3 Tax=Linum tenue TaxID=586396 RepID=A0AAV0KPQ4_9ROSI|nr:unnamed protein product [Linum tenue]
MIIHGESTKYHQRLLRLLEATSRVRSLGATKCLHALLFTFGGTFSTQTTFLHNNIITLYASVKEFLNARKVFDRMPQRNTVSYNSMICCYSRFGCPDDAWRALKEMMACGLRPNQFTLGGMLSCASMDLSHGVRLQSLAMKSGLLAADAFVGTSLLGLFGRYGCLEETSLVFQDMPKKSLTTWNSIISCFASHGLVEDSMGLFCELVRAEEGTLSEGSFVGVLSGLARDKDLGFGQQVHGLAMKIGLDCEVPVSNTLVNMYVKCGSSTSLAERMFQDVKKKDIVTWNTLMGALAKSQKPGKAMELFKRLYKEDDVRPNQTTFVSLVQSCTASNIPMFGEAVHAFVIINAFQTDAYVGNALVDYYAKCSKLDYAYNSFLEIREKNVVCWNGIVLAFSNESSSLAVPLLQEMLLLGFRPNESSFSAILKSLLLLELCQVHCLIMKMGYENNEYVLSALIASYDREGLIHEARRLVVAFETLGTVLSNTITGILNRSGQYHESIKLLSELEEPDAISWNIVLAACARDGHYKEVTELFRHMLMVGIRPDNYTYVSLLSTCSKICMLPFGSTIHGLLIKTNFSACDAFVCNVLIDMYGKCGRAQSSRKVFDEMKEKNIITWTVLISALGNNGRAYDAIRVFKQLESLGHKPDKVAFSAVLTACRHGGLAREGMELFKKMNGHYGIKPELDHYHCLVDVLARSGHISEAEKLIGSMPFPPNARIWRSFLEGCKGQRDIGNRVMIMPEYGGSFFDGKRMSVLG